ncbi:MAG: sensor histidine kinase, partial [Chryseotalea sp.]
MNKKRKLIVLIAVSLVLLLGLQGYWLEKAYEKAYSDLKRISNIEFRNVIFQLRDSILVHTFTGYSDSSFQRSQPADISGITFQSAQIDSVNVNTKKSKVQILISSDNKNKDSIYKAFKPLSKNIRSKFNSADNFVIKITPDSLPADSIKHYFTKSMMKLGLVTQIEITSKTPEFESFRFGVPTFPEMLNPLKENDVWFPQSIETEFVRLNPFRTYKATLPEIGNILFKQIAAQIFLSVTLTILIAFVLIILYKNLVAQQRLVEQKDDLISNISHELKTPIATVSVALEAIAQFDNTRPDKQKEYLGMARQELTRLTSLTEKILLTSFAENQQIKIQYKPVVLQDVVQQTLQSYKLVFEKHEAHIIVNISETPLTVTGNAEFLTQALHNILD